MKPTYAFSSIKKRSFRINTTDACIDISKSVHVTMIDFTHYKKTPLPVNLMKVLMFLFIVEPAFGISWLRLESAKLLRLFAGLRICKYVF